MTKSKGVPKSKEHRANIQLSMLRLWEMRRAMGYRFSPEGIARIVTGVKKREKKREKRRKLREANISPPQNDNSVLAGEKKKGVANG